MPTYKFDDVEIYYQIQGEGPPLLLIHGLGSSSRDWEFQIEDFVEDYQVITFDVRGHGRSSKPASPYSIPLFAEDTAKLIKELGLAPVHVAGISMGGMIAFQLAIDHPELVKSLVIANSDPDYSIKDFKQRLQVWQRIWIVRLLGMRKMGEVLSGRLFPKEEQLELRELFIERWAENDPRAYQSSFKAIVGWSAADQLQQIKAPTLVIASDQDYTPVSVKEACVKKIPNAKLAVIEDARHAVPVEKPEAFNALLAEFLTENP